MAPLEPFMQQLRDQNAKWALNDAELDFLRVIKSMLDQEVVAKHLPKRKFAYDFPRSEPALELHTREQITGILRD
eukprot:2895810-Rhodomonas_salina.1